MTALAPGPEPVGATPTGRRSAVVRRWLASLRLELFVATATAVGVLLLRGHGLRLDARTVVFVADATIYRFPQVLLIGFVLRFGACLVRRQSPVVWLRRLVRPASLIVFVRAWLATMVMTYTYLWLKIAVPLVNARLYDGFFWRLDRWLHLGVSPSIFAVEWLAGSPLLGGIDRWYALWLTTVFATQAYVFFGTERRRLDFAYACALLWLGGAALYLLVPAVGPCFFQREVFDSVRAGLPAEAALQAKLWANYLQMIAGREAGTLIRFQPFFAVAAMPSVHVGAHWLFALWARRRVPRLFPLFATATALTFLGSIVTGWHYAIDGYVGMLLAWGAVRLALGRAAQGGSGAEGSAALRAERHQPEDHDANDLQARDEEERSGDGGAGGRNPAPGARLGS